MNNKNNNQQSNLRPSLIWTASPSGYNIKPKEDHQLPPVSTLIPLL